MQLIICWFCFQISILFRQVSISLSQKCSSSIQLYKGAYMSRLLNLNNLPVCNPRDFYTLEEICDEGVNLQSCVNLLACVKKVVY